LTAIGYIAPSPGGDIAPFCDPDIPCSALIVAAYQDIIKAENHEINDDKPGYAYWDK